MHDRRAADHGRRHRFGWRSTAGGVVPSGQLGNRYVAFTFSDPLVGVAEVLDSSGLAGQVSLTGLALSDVSIAGLVDGTARAWVAQPIDYESWLMVDSMARLSVGMELEEERSAANLPTWVVDSPKFAAELVESGRWPGPDGYVEQFMALWGLP